MVENNHTCLTKQELKDLKKLIKKAQVTNVSEAIKRSEELKKKAYCCAKCKSIWIKVMGE